MRTWWRRYTGILHTLGLESSRHETAHLFGLAISFFYDGTFFVLFSCLESALALDEAIARLVILCFDLAVQENWIKLIRCLGL